MVVKDLLILADIAFVVAVECRWSERRRRRIQQRETNRMPSTHPLISTEYISVGFNLGKGWVTVLRKQ